MAGSNGCLDKGMRALSIAVALAFILVLPLTLLGRDLAKVIFSPENVSGILRSRLLDSGFVNNIAAENFLSERWFNEMDLGGGELKPMFQNLSQAEREEILATLMPPEWVDAQLDSVIHAFFTWIDNEKPAPRIAVDLMPLKDVLLKGGLRRTLDTVIDSWPSCTTDEIEIMSQELIRTGVIPIEVCEPPEPYRSQVLDFAVTELGSLIREQPDKLQLIESLEVPPAEISEFKEQLQFLRSVMMWGWFFPASLLGVIMILIIRSMRDLGQWWGIPLLIGGLLSIVVILIISAGRNGFIGNLLAESAQAGTLFYRAFEIVLLGIFVGVIRLAFFHALVITSAGLALWLITRKVSMRAGAHHAIKPEPGDEVPAEHVSGIPSPPPVPPLGSGPDDDEGPPSGIFG
ncbi:MAG: hypothetical protein KAR65_09295 [Anaerolineales bacterium]|nr:hypothetical protein [Anaerolineales bacterium]MCK5634716.1 hypothetical protein [Anaerolineales bacterium]